MIVGSGFTGFTCARRLAKTLRRAPVDITMISPVDYMLYTPLLPDVAGGVVDARFVAVPLANSLRGMHAVRGRVDAVDFTGRTLTYRDPEERSHSMSWDRLVLTPGSVTKLFDVPGLARHARGLKTTAEALYLRDHFVEQLELANIEDDPRVAAARRTVVVVGASYSGTELVAQLRALADAAARQMGFDPGAVRFLLLDLAEQVMPEVGKKLGDAALKVLRRRGIDVRLGTTLKEAHADHVVLSDGSRIDTHTIAWVTGVTGAPLIQDLGLPTEKGRLKVQPDLQVPAIPACSRPGRRRGSRPHPARQDHPADRPARDPAGQGAGPQRGRQPGSRQRQGIQAPQPGSGGRPRTALRGGQPAQHSLVGAARQGRHPGLSPVCDSARREPVGGVAGLPHRRAVRPLRRIHRAVLRGRRAIHRQRGHSDAEDGLSARRLSPAPPAARSRSRAEESPHRSAR
ncbi:pyridine nucleotide-disulfide oxidoreductase family protein [Mycobacterium avium subsp. avium 2285 (R)]|nr:pyridine nucleotide-disulfide oxidoreductase family protein [Mycobacterium avium subsp. avium 2285 (R)]